MTWLPNWSHWTPLQFEAQGSEPETQVEALYLACQSLLMLSNAAPAVSNTTSIILHVDQMQDVNISRCAAFQVNQ